MATRAATAKRTFLPAGFATFMSRRAIEFGGLLLVLVALAVAAALISFNPADPSLNTQTDAATQNWLGLPGAYLADLLIQTMGLAAYGLTLALVCWGWRIISHQGLASFWLYATLLPLALVASAVAATAIDPAARWRPPK